MISHCNISYKRALCTARIDILEAFARAVENNLVYELRVPMPQILLESNLPRFFKDKCRQQHNSFE